MPIRSIYVGLAFVTIQGCSLGEACEEGFVRSGEGCVAYEASEPLVGNVRPLPTGVSWQWQLTGALDRSHDVAVYDVDLFRTTGAEVDALHDDGRIVICYFSAGSFEPWRPDANRFPEEAIGRPLAGWPDERWLDPVDPTVRQIMLDRLDRARDLGCDGVEPDNITAYDARSGFPVNLTEQLDYDRFIADEAHRRDLSVAMKNDVENVAELLRWYDFAVNEECAAFDECSTLAPFVDADKAVLHAEYVDDWVDATAREAEVCGIEPGLSTIVKTWDLGPELLACD